VKISIAASILILLLAALFGFHGQQQLVTVRETHDKLVASANQLGISIYPSRPSTPVRITKREREDKEADAKAAAVEFIAFAREMEANREKGVSTDEAQQKRQLKIMDRMMSLDSAQLKILIAEVSAAKDLKDETRGGLIGSSIMTLSNDHPQAALALLTESSDLFEGVGMGSHVISSSLAKWAKDDPLAALEWVRNNSAKFPDLITERAKQGLISGTAIQDPKLAFKMIGDLGLENSSFVVTGIVRAATTPEQRTATLAALREHLANLKDEKARKDLSRSAVYVFAQNCGKEGFDSSSQWITSAGFTPAELESFAGGLNGSIKNGENGRWIEWIGENLPPHKAAEKIESMVRGWTHTDFQAAGNWINSVPDGPTKNTAIRSYALTVSGYEPETAAQWALTLPPGKDRDSTLNRIYQNWPKDDPAAKEAFKQQHGIK
jgi:hypothetical protein